MIRLNSEEFQNLHFWASIVIFDGKVIKNYKIGEFSDFYEFTLDMIIQIFYDNNGFFPENRENHK